MILDKISNSGLYTKISKQIAKALKLAAETDFGKIESGNYEVDGKKLYYSVQRYKTKPVYEKIESHKNYIDLQLIAKGNEQIGYASIDNLTIHTAYDDSKDVQFFNPPKNTTFLKMSKGDFAIFWPTDAHMPGCQIQDSEDVLKIVFKIKV
jgi:YhcH/YjgK/YiaL family protein